MLKKNEYFTGWSYQPKHKKDMCNLIHYSVDENGNPVAMSPSGGSENNIITSAQPELASLQGTGIYKSCI